MYQETEAQKKKEEKSKEKEESDYKKETSMYYKNGELRQCNEGKYEFKLEEWEDPQYTTFTIKVPKYLDTEYIKINIFNFYISVRVKDKLTQIKLFEEVLTDSYEPKRNIHTGELVIKVKKVRYDPKLEKIKTKNCTKETKAEENNTNKKESFSSSDLPELE